MLSQDQTPAQPTPYIGRFAPSPTGPLHQGSLLTAVASYLDARQHGGQWLVRMEDLDPPREQRGAANDILRCLEAHGLCWDGSVMWQSQRHSAYRAALVDLKEQGHTFLCDCTRQRLKSLSNGYDGHCRHLNLQHQSQHPCATRLRVPSGLFSFNDRFQGAQQQDLEREVGDFTIHRKDGLFAYQLAVVIDDIQQGISHVIRGCDLLDSTPRQLLLFDLFDRPRPTFGHIPLILNSDGQKLSKQNLAPALDNNKAKQSLSNTLLTLGLPLPSELYADACNSQLAWAVEHWHKACLPKGQEIPSEAAAKKHPFNSN